MVQIDARIKIKSAQLRTMRLQVAQMINPAVTQKQMETAKATPFPMAQYAGVASQTDWRTIVLGWIKLPGNLNKYLEIAGDIVMMHSAWDPAVGYYRSTGIDLIAPIHWTPLQQEGDPIGFVRALQSQMLFDEIVTHGGHACSCSTGLQDRCQRGIRRAYFDCLGRWIWSSIDPSGAAASPNSAFQRCAGDAGTAATSSPQVYW